MYFQNVHSVELEKGLYISKRSKIHHSYAMCKCHTCEIFWVRHWVRQLLVALSLGWHGRHHHAIWELLLDAPSKVLLPGLGMRQHPI